MRAIIAGRLLPRDPLPHAHWYNLDSRGTMRLLEAIRNPTNQAVLEPAWGFVELRTIRREWRTRWPDVPFLPEPLPAPSHRLVPFRAIQVARSRVHDGWSALREQPRKSTSPSDSRDKLAPDLGDVNLIGQVFGLSLFYLGTVSEAVRLVGESVGWMAGLVKYILTVSRQGQGKREKGKEVTRAFRIKTWTVGDG